MRQPNSGGRKGQDVKQYSFLREPISHCIPYISYLIQKESWISHIEDTCPLPVWDMYEYFCVFHLQSAWISFWKGSKQVGFKWTYRTPLRPKCGSSSRRLASPSFK